MSESKRQLASIPVRQDHLPKEEPYTSWARQEHQRFTRDWNIYMDWLKADDKAVVVQTLADKWGLKPGHVTNVVEKVGANGNLPADKMAQAEAVRLYKRHTIMKNGQEYRIELAAQVHELEGLREDGEKWVEVQEEDSTGGQYGSGTKTKKVSISSHIALLKKEIVRSEKEEAEALSLYMPKAAETQDVRHWHVDATDEFKELFSRAQEVRPGNEEGS